MTASGGPGPHVGPGPLASPDGAERRLEGMDGLRGVGAFVIVVAHVWLNLGMAAPLGRFPALIQRAPLFLVMFFVLSAFLLYRPFVAAAVEGRHASVRRYALHRARRILPAYWLVLGASGLLLGVATVVPFTVQAGMAPALPETGWLWAHPLLLAVNGALLQTLLPGTMMTGVGPAWTLTVELCFYLVLPCLAWLSFRVLRRVPPLRAAWLGPVVLAAVGLAAKWVHLHVLLAGMTPVEAFFADWGPTWQAVFARSVLVQADVLGIGMAAAVLVVRGEVPRWVVGVLVAGGLVLSQASHTWGETGWGLFWAGIVLVIATRQRSMVARFFAAGPVHWAGQRSYSVYLWHLPVILLLARLGWNAPATAAGFLLNCVMVLAAVYLLADLTWRFVERPFLRRR